eukprot:GFKZ01013173.1.p1 GENE.GFKZ01013173.1~~GFKZ01013173.1.p1  ORF type:complete len:767 (-),score=90.69 GFKZ01013173.1:2277-4577(-)
MATRQSFDIVHELQLELGWKPDFAQDAHAEYMKWLQLRAQAGDFQMCKLPPSRVVALIWNVHRQWTLDYEQTCLKLGGFLHHFPPAMRMNIAREQAYAVTLHTYKSHFKEDPPSAYWGPAIYPYKPFTSNNEIITPAAPREPPTRRSHASLRRSPVKRDTTRPSPASAKGKNKAPENISRRVSASTSVVASGSLPEASRSNVEEGRPLRRASKASKEVKSQPHIPILSDDPEDDTANQSKKTRRKFPGSSSLYVLKPLGPGEKRKRGRPSFSDYMLASGAEVLPVHEPKRRSSAAEKVPTPKSPGASTHSLRRRKSTTTALRLSLGPAIKKEKSNTGSSRRGRLTSKPKTATDPAPTAAAAVARPDIKGNSKAAASSAPAKASPKATNNTARTTEENDGAILIRRPRGRPRKDGSWPISRARKADSASKPTPSSAVKPTASVAAKTQQQRRGFSEKAAENTKDPKRDGQKATLGNARVSNPGPLPTSTIGTSTAVPVSKAAPQTARIGMPAKGVMAPVAKKDASAVAVKNDAVGNSTTPSKSIEAADIRVQSLAEKDVPKPQDTQMPGQQSRGGIFDPVAESSGTTDKTRAVVEAPNAPVGKNPQAMQDISFQQSESVTDRMSVDNALGSAPRTDPGSSVPMTAAVATAPPPPASDKFIPHVPAFQMPTIPLNPLPSPVENNILPLAPAGVPPKADSGTVKDGTAMDVDGEESKMPFKRLRGRPRKEISWPNVRPKTIGDGAPERAKDLSETAPPPNLPMGPPGTV